MKNVPNFWARVPGAAMAAALAGIAVAGCAPRVNDLPGGPAVNQLNLHPAATQIAQDIIDLHWMIMVICTIIFIGVFGVMFYAIMTHRKSRGAVPATWHESVPVEITWTLVPFVIVILIAMPATKVIVAQKDTTNSDITIKATGYQWKWGYDYLSGEGEGISFLSTLDPAHRAMSATGKPAGDDYLLKVDNPLVLPVGKKIRVITTANDVIHSWFMPSFGVKQDAIPGFVRDTWFRADHVGDFFGHCAELCGKEHAYMPIHVKILPEEEYTQWVAEQQAEQISQADADDADKEWGMGELLARGEKVYAANCAACHQESGQGAGPIKALDGSAIVQGPVAEEMHVVLEGRANGAMPSWAQLSDVELAAVVTYTKNTWGNDTGQLVQPAQFAAARNGDFPSADEATDSARNDADAANDHPGVKVSVSDYVRSNGSDVVNLAPASGRSAG